MLSLANNILLPTSTDTVWLLTPLGGSSFSLPAAPAVVINTIKVALASEQVTVLTSVTGPQVLLQRKPPYEDVFLPKTYP